MKTVATLVLLLILLGNWVFAQLDSIYDQGNYRTYIVHLPPNYTVAQQYPLVLNLHGLNSNAAQQQSYSQMDAIADTAAFIVVYPNGLNNSWQINGTSDVDFLTHLVDSLRHDFSIGNCLFATGMSDGGFMTYKLACSLGSQLKAIGVVSGNMSNALQNNCAVTAGLPLLHIHGTADPLVNYNGTFGIPPVDTTIQFWVQNNLCSNSAIHNFIPNINLADSCNAETFEYVNGTNGSRVIFYKIFDGGHTWPGATPAPPLGNTCQDFDASIEIWRFFRSYCATATSIMPQSSMTRWSIFPNPARDLITISIHVNGLGTAASVCILDILGRPILRQFIRSAAAAISIDISSIPCGNYIVMLIGANAQLFHAKLSIRR